MRGIIEDIYWAMGFGDEVWDARKGRKALAVKIRNAIYNETTGLGRATSILGQRLIG